MTENRTPANSGVRNLRAMFESQSATSSPEPRGRSPSRRIINDSDRPASKVKASFVSVGPLSPTGPLSPASPLSSTSFPLGTTKGTPAGVNSPEARRRESFSISTELGEEKVEELKKVVSDEKNARRCSLDVAEVVPEQAVATRESSRAPPPIRRVQTATNMPNLGSIMKGSDFPEPRSGKEDAEKDTSKQETKAESIGHQLAAMSLGDDSPQEATPSPENVPAETPADNPDKIVTGAQEEVSLKPADPEDEAAISGGEALPSPTEVLPSSQPKTPQVAKNASKVASSNARSPTKTNGATPAKKPAPIFISKASAATGSTSTPRGPLPRSPGGARLPRTPITPRGPHSASTVRSATPAKEQQKPATPKPAAPKEAAKVPAKAPVKPVVKAPTKAPVPKTSASSLKSASSTTTASAVTKAKAPVVENKKPIAKSTTTAPAARSHTTSPGGFKKPKPKSPTRPVRLPSHLTAPTAASAAKHGEEAAQKIVRKPSAATRPAAPKVAAPAARKPPSRASLAPAAASAKRPESRASTVGGAEDGFLARMMRPTASSASKTHDKPASPPRRGASLRASVKPKPGHESVLAKGKRKIEDLAAKAKETVTNGHDEEHQSQNTESVTSNRTSLEEANNDAQAVQPEQGPSQAEASTAELSAPTPEAQEAQ